jgi:hypothetical protein
MNKTTSGNDKIVGVLFHDSDSRLCLLDDSGKHAVVVESEDGMLSFVDGVMMTDMKIATWDGSPNKEIWESGIFEDLLSDLEDDDELDKLVEHETIPGILLIRE